MEISGSDSFGQKIIDILGLRGKAVRDIHIHIKQDDLVLVNIERILLNDEADDILTMLEYYELKKIEDGKNEGK